MPLTQAPDGDAERAGRRGAGDRVRIGASGKVAAGNDIVRRLIQGAEDTNAARAKMMAISCIQAQMCHADRCPVGVATQNQRR